MTDHSTDAEDLLDHIAALLEVTFKTRDPFRIYVAGPDGKCRLDLEEVSMRLERLIDQLHKTYQVEY